MRILYIFDMKVPNRAANTVQVMKMCSALAEAGCEVTLAARPEREHDPARGKTNLEVFEFYAVKPNFRLVHVPRKVPGQSGKDKWSTPFSLSAAAYAKELRGDYDVIYSRTALVANFCARRGMPVVYEAHRPLPTGGMLSAMWRRLFFGAARKPSFLGMVSISRQLTNIFEREGFPPGRTLVAHDAVDLERFTPRLDKAQARAERGLPVEGAIVCHCGHLYKGRGTAELLGAAQQMRETLFLFVGGSEGDVKAHQEEAARMGLNNTRFTGFIPNGEIPGYLFAADAVVMPYTSAVASKDYMSPMKLFEYLAAGRPIVATDFPSVREILNEKNAILVMPDSADALASGLRRALQPESAKLAENALETAQEYTWKRRVEHVTRFLEQSLARGG
jgi:glycosyltransferase involved in cell wall biosynthesis